MDGNDRRNRVTRFIAVASLVVAMVAILVPYLQQRAALEVDQAAVKAERSALEEQKRQFAEQDKERLDVSAEQGEGLVRRVRNADGLIVQVPWDLVLSNNGRKALSVTDASVSLAATSTDFYYGIDGGVYDDRDQPLRFPVTLQPGESRKYLVYVGLRVPPKVEKVLVRLKDPLTVRGAWEALLAQSLDLFGNHTAYVDLYGTPVSSFDQPGPYIAIRYGGSAAEPTSSVQPTFKFLVLTGGGGQFATDAEYY